MDSEAAERASLKIPQLSQQLKSMHQSFIQIYEHLVHNLEIEHSPSATSGNSKEPTPLSHNP